MASDRTIDTTWILVITLGVVTQMSLGLVHLNKAGAQITAPSVLSIAVVMALGLIGLQARPFAGDVRVEPGPLVELANTITQ
ncbi:hypothetical protein HU230_0021640 [Bradyrhizobium quebecense]|uniref:Uncharacterized protein n=1 Tax=Bradyrhizobium quebecense TaxID=2748629 RepID=A0A974AC72_9BRAD|nr:hypothetical protein [Bradyrhizobium quebecense]UGA41006.1 hypothetical protein HU230_0021640 [Bradyrhizobium quebecense]